MKQDEENCLWQSDLDTQKKSRLPRAQCEQDGVWANNDGTHGRMRKASAGGRGRHVQRLGGPWVALGPPLSVGQVCV